MQIEPTDAMVKAGIELAMRVKLGGDYTWAEYMRDIYRAMVSARPDDIAVERVARAIYIITALHGDEERNRDHLEAIFGPNSRPDFQHYGDRPRAAARAAIAALGGSGDL